MSKKKFNQVLNPYIFFSMWMKDSFGVSEDQVSNLATHFDNEEAASSKEIYNLIAIVSQKYQQEIDRISQIETPTDNQLEIENRRLKNKLANLEIQFELMRSTLNED